MASEWDEEIRASDAASIRRLLDLLPLVILASRTDRLEVDYVSHGVEALLGRTPAEMRDYEHLPLVELQGLSAVPRGTPLFESIFVFENFPFDPSSQSAPGKLTIRRERTVERTNYPLTVVAAFRRRLTSGQPIAAALEIAHQTAGRAMIFSTLALVIGFLALTTSGFIPTVSFGALSCLTLTGGLFGNLVVLPVLLTLLAPWIEAR